MKQKKEISGKVFTDYVKFTKSDKHACWDPSPNNRPMDVKVKRLLKKNSLVKLIQVKSMLVKWGDKNKTGHPVRIAIEEKRNKYWIGVFRDTHEGCILLIESSGGRVVELFISEQINDNGFTLLQKLEKRELTDEINALRNAYQEVGS